MRPAHTTLGFENFTGKITEPVDESQATAIEGQGWDRNFYAWYDVTRLHDECLNASSSHIDSQLSCSGRFPDLLL